MKEKISFGPFRRVYIPINIKPLDDTTMKPLGFKVDTGADFTTISKENLYALGYTKEWIKENAVVEQGNSTTTATGEVIASGIVQLPLINILGYEAKNWPFGIVLGEGKDYRNLLGRDLLSGFNYTFNNDREQLEIERAETYTYIYPKIDGQEIHEIGSTTSTEASLSESTVFGKR